jgi:hypothetical protein
MASEDPDIIGFHAVRTRQLRRAGFEGRYVWVGMRDGALELIGEVAGFLRIPADEVARMRAGFVLARPKAFQTVLWLRGGGPPIFLHPLPHHASYASTVRALASAMSADGGMCRVEGGISPGGALFGPLLMAVPAFGAVALAGFVVTDALWWQRLAVPAVPLLCFALLAWIALARQMPRRIRTLASLDRQLPPATARGTKFESSPRT